LKCFSYEVISHQSQSWPSGQVHPVIPQLGFLARSAVRWQRSPSNVGWCLDGNPTLTQCSFMWAHKPQCLVLRQYIIVASLCWSTVVPQFSAASLPLITSKCDTKITGYQAFWSGRGGQLNTTLTIWLLYGAVNRLEIIHSNISHL
jgi:hypothetical protein